MKVDSGGFGVPVTLTREELIAICVAAEVPVTAWRDRDYPECAAAGRRVLGSPSGRMRLHGAGGERVDHMGRHHTPDVRHVRPRCATRNNPVLPADHRAATAGTGLVLMTDPGLADRIRHAARVSQSSAVLHHTAHAPWIELTPDRLTVERRGWRYSSESRYRVLDMMRFLRCTAGRQYWLGLWSLNVWWTREGLRCDLSG